MLYYLALYLSSSVLLIVGGLWRYTDKVTEGQACVMKSTIINTSKEMMCYSDFPIPDDYPVFMHNTYVQKYFNLYADKFGLRKYIKFKTEVTLTIFRELYFQFTPTLGAKSLFCVGICKIFLG